MFKAQKVHSHCGLRRPLDPHITYTNSYGKVFIIHTRWMNTVKNLCTSGGAVTAHTHDPGFPVPAICSAGHWQFIALLKLPTVQREFSFRVPLPFHVQDIFGSMFSSSIHWKENQENPNMPACQQVLFLVQVPEDDGWACQAYSSGQRELAEVLCYWKKSQILISSPLLTLITFSTCSQEWSLDSKP